MTIVPGVVPPRIGGGFLDRSLLKADCPRRLLLRELGLIGAGLLASQEIGLKIPGSVINDALSIRNIRIRRHSHRFESHILEAQNRLFQREAVLNRQTERSAIGLNQSGEGRSFLTHLDEDFARRTIVVDPDRQVSLVAVDRKLMRDRISSCRETPAMRLTWSIRRDRCLCAIHLIHLYSLRLDSVLRHDRLRCRFSASIRRRLTGYAPTPPTHPPNTAECCRSTSRLLS